MKITSYGFGNIHIDNKKFTSDLKIIRGRIKPDWWRRAGHRLEKEDILDIIEANPRILIVGTGYSGLMRVAEGLAEEMERLGISMQAMPSKNAVAKFNELVEKHGADDVAFAIHLTC